MKKITDTWLAEQVKMTQQSFARWKKNRPEVYAAIRGYYELKEECEKYKKIEAILKDED